MAKGDALSEDTFVFAFAVIVITEVNWQRFFLDVGYSWPPYLFLAGYVLSSNC